MARVLGRLRLSLSREESTSILKQETLIRQWADAHGHEVVGLATDDGVSGAVNPWETPGLGPWLNTRLDDFDIIAVYKLDRLSRKASYLHKIFDLCKAEDKTLVSISDSFDLSTTTGEMLASILGYLGQAEHDAIKDRQSSSRKQLRTLGRFGGGTPPYGYMPAPLDGGGRTLVQNPDTAPIIRRIVNELIEGIPAEHVARRLNAEGVPAPRGGQWRSNSIRHAARHKTLIGHQIHKSSTVLDDDGEPIMATAEPILDWETFQKTQDALDNAGNPKRFHRTSPLLGIIKCWDCGGTMHFTAVNSRREKAAYRYFVCSKKCVGVVNADELIQSVYALFLDELGDHLQQRKQVTRPKDHSARIAEIREALDNLAEAIAGATGGAAKPFLTRTKKLQKELAQLEDEHNATARVDWVSTGRTYRQDFEEADAQGKRQLMLKAGIVVRAKPMHLEFIVPEDLKRRLGIQ